MSKPPPKDKELTIPEKLKQLLRINKSITQTPADEFKSRCDEFVLTSEVLKEIGPEAATSQRIKMLKRLIEEIEQKKMAANSVETIWLKIRDMVQPQQQTASRQVAFGVLKMVIKTQYNTLKLMRAEFFNLINTHDVPEDLIDRIEVLQELSLGGREIEHFEDEIGPFLLHFTSPALMSTSALEYLKILLNFIKFHSTYLDKEVVKTIVKLTCEYVCQTSEDFGVELSIQVLEAVICYSCLPSESLECIITALCRTVNVAKFCEPTWKLVRNILGTHLGHSGLYIMCSVLQESENHDNIALLRGAVFFIGMCLWGSQKVGSLKFTHSVVLPYFLRALDPGHTLVAHEVSFSIERLVRKYGEELQSGTWDLVMDVIEALIKHTQARSTTTSALLASKVHEILSTVEELHEQKQYNGCENRLFSVIEKCSARRPESSVLRLVSFLAKSINPLKSNWLVSLRNLLDTYYKHENKTVVRIKVLEILSNILHDNRHIYEDDIVERIILPILDHVETDQDIAVRNAAVLLLIDVAQECGSKSCNEVLEILSKVILHPFDQSHFPGGKQEAQETVHVVTDNEIIDVKTAVEGLIDLFQKKLYVLPSSIAITIFGILVKYLHLQYESFIVSKDASVLRISIFDCFLKLRAKENHQLGIVPSASTETLQYSSYLLCIHSDKHLFGNVSPQAQSPTLFPYPIASPTYLSLEPLFQIVTLALKQEKDWSVLKHLLIELPKLLQNKSLLLSANGSVEALCKSVCELLGNRNLNLPETLRNAPVTLSRSEFHLHVYPVQVALVSYQKYLDRDMQLFLVTCLRHGLNSKCARASIIAFTVCILEMNDTMYKLLPEVLLGLSKISATVNIAIPILEFLSTLIRLPKLYASFVQDQYMIIFAIALPYTNPFKFNHYTVSLAHHVIAMWFIKCRLSFRKDFVRFIVKGLRNNVLVPFDEGAALSDIRSSHAETKEQEQGSCSGSKRNDIHEALSIFHKELTETCIDLLTRYTFTCCSILPKRSLLAEFLLKAGQSMSWLLGNAIITITTSGCSTRASKFGLCEKCYTFCRTGQQGWEDTPAGATSEQASEIYQTRRRHHSAAVQRSLSIDSQEFTPRSKDDIQIKFRGDDGSSMTDPVICSCWCRGWAEVLIRRPTGNTSWVMRIQNRLYPSGSSNFPLSEIARLLLSSYLINNDKPSKFVNKFGHERIDSESLEESECDALVQQVMSISSNDEKLSDSGSIGTGNDLPGEINKEVAQEGTAETSEPDDALEKNSLRKTNSSPDIRMDFEAQEDGKAEANSNDGSKAASGPSTEISHDQQKHETTHNENIPHNPGASLAAKATLHSDLNKASAGKDKVPPKISIQELPAISAFVEKAGGSDLEVVRMRRGSGIDKRPPRLPDIGEQRDIHPLQKTKSVPLSPLPLVQVAVDHPDLIPIKRDRGHTISVMSPVRHKGLPGAAPPKAQEGQQQGINPSFVFLQLYYSFRFGVSTDRPILLPKLESVERALKVLDHIPPYDTHKIGVLYVGPGQVDSEAAILGNEFGSIRYVNFLHGLGRLVMLKDVNPQELYVGGLDLSGPDGKFAYVWQDDVMQVIFHVATLMPNKKHDPSCNEKKLHIGNDFVSIVYNDSGQDYNIHTIKGQFMYACVVIQPLDQESNLVIMKTKPEFSEKLLCNSDPKIVSDRNLAILVRQLALHANLASMILQSQQRSQTDPYASNWLERLRQIRRLREKRLAEAPPPSDDDIPGQAGWSRYMDDFTSFV